MKSFASVALFGAALVAAAPLNEKRDIVWHTTWTEVTETVMTTTTKWVAPGAEVSAAAANPGGDFHETAVHFSGNPQYTHSAYSVPSFSKPAPPAPTTTTTAAPVPTTTSSTEETTPTPAPVTTSTPPPPPPPSTTTTPTSTYVAPTPTSTYVAPVPTSTYIPPPPPSPTTTSTYIAPTTTTPAYVAPTTTTPTYIAPTTSTAAPASTSPSTSSGSYTNVDLTYYTPGMGSCGIVSTESEAVVAVAANTMTKTYSGNPNNNPLCGKKVSITANGVTKSATIVDTCPGCLGPTDLDLSPSLFSEFADESVGRITGASWSLE